MTSPIAQARSSARSVHPAGISGVLVTVNHQHRGLRRPLRQVRLLQVIAKGVDGGRAGGPQIVGGYLRDHAAR